MRSVVYMHSVYALFICTLYKCTKNMHSVYVSCALYMHSVYMHCPAKSYKSFLLSTRYGFSFLCVRNCTQHTAIIVLQMVPVYYFFYGLWGSSLLCDTILHNIARKGFCNAARTWMKECLCNFYFHVYVCWSFLCLSWPNCEKLCWISLAGEWGESNSMWPCQCRE